MVFCADRQELIDTVRVFLSGNEATRGVRSYQANFRFRLIVNQVNLVRAEHPLPKLPVARAIWIPEPNPKIAATAWILAGGAHHTSLSRALSQQHLEDFAEMAGIECLLIDDNTTIENFNKELKRKVCIITLLVDGPTPLQSAAIFDLPRIRFRSVLSAHRADSILTSTGCWRKSGSEFF